MNSVKPELWRLWPPSAAEIWKCPPEYNNALTIHISWFLQWVVFPRVRLPQCLACDTWLHACSHFRQVLARCLHPNIVRLLSACVTPPRLCIVMELMETSLEKILYASSRAGDGGSAMMVSQGEHSIQYNWGGSDGDGIAPSGRSLMPLDKVGFSPVDVRMRGLCCIPGCI